MTSNFEYRMPSTAVSRRGLLRRAGVAGAGLSAAALVGCSSKDERAAPVTGGTGSTPETSLVRKGTIRQSTGKLSEPFDPAIMLSAGATYWSNWGNTAINVGKQDYKLMPALAESWEVKSPTEIALKIRQGVAFHDKAPTNGRIMDATDVAYSFNRHAALLDKDKAALYPRRTNFRFMTEAVATDKSTVVLKMSAPNSAILNGIADMRCPIMPVESKDTGFADGNKVVGTGPWVIKQLDTTGTGTLVPNLKYWEKGLPKAESVTLQTFDTYQASTAAFVSDVTDYLHMINQPWAVVQEVGKLRPDAQKIRWDYGLLHWLRYNCKKAPFSDERVRQAMTVVVDGQAIGEGFYGELTKPSGPFVSTWGNSAISSAEIMKRPGWNPATREADIANAKKLFAAAGFPDGELNFNLMVFNTPVHPSNSQRVRAQWNRIWPKMKITLEGPFDSGPFNQRLAAGNFDTVAYSILTPPDAAVDFQNQFATEGSRNYGFFSNPEVDKLTSDSISEFDMQKRAVLLKQAEEILIQKAPMLPYYYAQQIAYVSPKWDGYAGYPGPAGIASSDLADASRFVSYKG